MLFDGVDFMHVNLIPSACYSVSTQENTANPIKLIILHKSEDLKCGSVSVCTVYARETVTQACMCQLLVVISR